MKFFMDRDYITKHLLSYTEFQLKQGYVLKDIKTALLKYGYDIDIVEEVIGLADESIFVPKEHKPSIRELNEDLYSYLQNLLVDYIKKEQKQGYSLDVIQRALVRYGHHPSMVKNAVRSVKEGLITDLMPEFNFPAGLMLAVSLAGIVGFSIFLMLQTDEPISTVFLCFSPSILMILLVYGAAAKFTESKKFIPLFGIAGTVILYVLLLRGKIIVVSEPQTILVLNIFFSFVGSSLISLFTSTRPGKVEIPVDAGEPEPKVYLPAKIVEEKPARKPATKKHAIKKTRLKLKEI